MFQTLPEPAAELFPVIHLEMRKIGVPAASPRISLRVPARVPGCRVQNPTSKRIPEYYDAFVTLSGDVLALELNNSAAGREGERLGTITNTQLSHDLAHVTLNRIL